MSLRASFRTPLLRWASLLLGGAIAAACTAPVEPDEAPAWPEESASDPGAPPAGLAPPPVIAPQGAGAPSSPPPVARPTPALSGGTLLILADGKTAIAADPDHDVLHFADLGADVARGSLPLRPGDEPGRLVEDARHRVHVVLRGAGAIATVEPSAPLSERVVNRRPVCPAPRGLAYDAAADRLLVACAGGELVALPPDGETTVLARLPRDLRDVVASGEKIFVTQFKTADLFVLSPSGQLLDRRRPPGSPAALRPLAGTTSAHTPAASPNVAWRLIPDGHGGAAMIHQESSNSELGTDKGGYLGGPCKSPIAAAITRFPETGAPLTSGQIMSTILPVDLAFSPDQKRVALVAAAKPASTVTASPQVSILAIATMSTGDCLPPGGGMVDEGGTPIEFRQPTGAPVALAFDGKGRLIVQTREPARLEILSHGGGNISLSDRTRDDAGHAIFHAATSFALACASCHPEGADDGRVWRFRGIGPRRTQNLRGGLLETAPFHWDGDMRDLGRLMSAVFSGRMGGGPVSASELESLGQWMNALPSPPVGAPRDPSAVARGKALFESARTGCTKCHSGRLFTNNATMPVGTGRPLQVPSLRGVGWRAPFMHTGCAATLAARFDPTCGGGDQHGTVSPLKPDEIGDLVAYLETL